MVQLTLILDNLRSANNVGSILRTCDAAGVSQIWCCGITPFPRQKQDHRPPEIIAKVTRQIAKTALGAEQIVTVNHAAKTTQILEKLRAQGYQIYALEQSPTAQNLFDFKPLSPAALIVGNEVSGIDPAVLAACDATLFIPQRGQKESLNVAVAVGIAIYQLLV